jgi:hypothetical protein
MISESRLLCGGDIGLVYCVDAIRSAKSLVCEDICLVEDWSDRKEGTGFYAYAGFGR